MTYKQKEDRIEAVGRNLLDVFHHLQKTACPKCNEATWSIEFQGNAIRLICETAMPRLMDEAPGVCGYEMIVYGTPVTDLPQPVFAHISETPVRKKKTASRRKSTSTRRRRTITVAV